MMELETPATSSSRSQLMILHNAMIVTMDPQSRVFGNGAIVIEQDRIKAIGRSSEILRDFTETSSCHIIDLCSQFVLPGLINTHVHTSQQLGRGIADDVDLITWLHDRIWPYESNMTEEDSYISTLLCGIELIHSGVTCFAEAGGQHVSGMAKAVELLGLRACLAESIMDSGEGLPASWGVRSADDCIQCLLHYPLQHGCLDIEEVIRLPNQSLNEDGSPINEFFSDEQLFLVQTVGTPWYADIANFLATGVLPQHWSNVDKKKFLRNKQKHMYEKHHNTADGRIRIWLGIRQIMNSTDRLLTETRDTAKELKTGIHMHVAEIPYENQIVQDTRGVEHGTVEYLEKIDFLQSNLLAAHSVWVDDTEISYLSKAGVKVSHCPAAAMRMLGFAPIKEMIDNGVCVSLGTDGAPSNNRMSIVDEMYLASLINKGREAYVKGTTDPTALSAETVLKMATVNGAKSVLWDNEIGSLETGKKADLVIINPFSWSMVPVHDSITSLVYSLRTENIVSVMCNGRWIMKDHKILSVDEGEVIAMARHASSQLLERAGIKIPKRMNLV